MAARAEAYVDTSALIAFADRSDSHHPLFRQLFADPPRLVTSALVVAEGHGWFLRRYDTLRALQFLAMIEDMTPLKVLAVGRAELDAATALLRRYSDRELTLTDAVGLHLMRARRIRHCWSTDRHLALAGATLAIDAN
ncbi:MAG: PIN domain-containing protein [Burkholderiales bacterium]|nr:PIN domain-containing protein [Burkholderiales bacterium]